MQALLQGQPLKLRLSGLDHMSDDPTDMHVLYLKVADVLGSQQRLQQLCELVIGRFKEAGLMQPVSCYIHSHGCVVACYVACSPHLCSCCMFNSWDTQLYSLSSCALQVPTVTHWLVS